MVSMSFEEIKTDARYNWQHVYFVSKKRRRVFLKEKTRAACKAAFEETAQQFDFEIRELGFGGDYTHVHIMLNVPSRFSMQQTIQIFKSHSASKIFELIPNFLKMYPDREFWSGWRYYGSVGPMTEQVVKEYIRRQDVSQKKLPEFT